MFMGPVFRCMFCLALVIVLGCTPVATSSGIKISTVRSPPTSLEKVSTAIKRSVYAKALESSRGASNLRIVPMIVSSSQAPSTPEYRLFNVRKGSVGDVLGLQNSDILIAAHDYVIQNPSQFYGYLTAVQNEKSSQIEIRRGDRPMILSFDFIDG